MEVEECASAAGLVGRREELGAVRRGLEVPGAVVVLAGEAGIGKSAVWRAALVGLSPEQRVLQAAAFEGEGLAYAALADLLSGLARDIDRLPAPSRGVLLSGVLQPDGGPVDERAVAVAVLALLRSLTGATIVAIDDVQWLDPPSAAALGYAVRRLGDTTARVLLTRRGEEPSPLEVGLRDRASVLTLGPLDDAATSGLVGGRVGGLTPTQTCSVVQQSAGNPLYAIELGRHLAGAGDPARLPPGIGALLGARLAAAPADAVDALTAVALSPGVHRGELMAAVGSDAVARATRSDLLEPIGEVVRATHPLLLTAAAGAVDPARARRLHAALAPAVGDALRGARHRGLAADGPDADLAALVSAAAATASTRLDRRMAGELGELALRLTPADDPARPERSVVLAGYHALAGDTARCLELIAAPETLPPGSLRARAYLLRTDVELVPFAMLVDYLDRALEEAGEDRITRARVLTQRAAYALRGLMRGIEEAEGWAAEAAQIAADDPAVRRLALFEVAWARAELGRPVDDLLAPADEDPGATPTFAFSVERVVAIRQMWRGELAQARSAFREMLASSDERGEEEARQILLTQLCELELRAGRWDAVERHVAEMSSVTQYQGGATSDPRWGSAVAAGRGDPAATEVLAAEADDPAYDAEVLRWPRFEVNRVRGLAALLDGASGRAVGLLLPIWEHLRDGGFVEPGAFPLAPDLVEALVAGGDLARARAVTEALAGVVDHPWAAASLLRARGHLAVAAGDDDAADLFRRAAKSYDRLGWAFDAARCLAHAGVALRAARRVREARECLQDAVASFDALGSPGWSRWAAAEIGRLGGRRSAGSGLTEAEEQVARLVAEGRRNKEVASEIFVSVSTVEATLTRVYAKLGVRSRAELVARLAER